ALPAALEQDADEVDDDVGAACRRLNGSRIAQVRLHGVDLTDAAERLEMEGQIGPAHRHANAVAALAQNAHNMAAEEAGTAENGDELLDVGLRDRRHGAPRLGRIREQARPLRTIESREGCIGGRTPRRVDKREGESLFVRPQPRWRNW